MGARLKRPPTAAWVWTFSVYSYCASTICAAWFVRHAGPVDAPTGLWSSLLWQGAVYAFWIPVAGAVWLILHRLGTGSKAMTTLTLIALPVTVFEAFATTGVARIFTGQPGSLASWADRALNHSPVALLLFTAIAMVGIAAAHHASASKARTDAQWLEAALADARRALDAAEADETPVRLLVSTGRRRLSVDLARVEWFASAGNYVVVHWDDGEGLVRETLIALEQRLDPAAFARSHRSTLVNLARVAEARSLSDGSWRLTMHSGAELVASRTYRDDILKRLGR